MAAAAPRMLNPDAASPLYRQLADLLRAQIDAGELLEGSKISSEHQLAREHNIGRPTVRQAIEWLSRRGYLERRRGSGTYVTARTRSVDLLSLAGTSSAFQSAQLPSQSELLSAPLEHAAEEAGPFGMQLDPFAGEAVVSFARQTSVEKDGEVQPVLVEVFALRARAFPGFCELDIQGRSVAELAEQHFDLRPAYAHQSFRVAIATKALAEALDLEAGTPVLEVHRQLYLRDETAIVHARLLCRTDRFDFSQRIDAAPDPSGDMP